VGYLKQPFLAASCTTTASSLNSSTRRAFGLTAFTPFNESRSSATLKRWAPLTLIAAIRRGIRPLLKNNKMGVYITVVGLATVLTLTANAQPLPEGQNSTSPPQLVPQPESWAPVLDSESIQSNAPMAESFQSGAPMAESLAGSAATLPTSRSIVVIGAGMAGMSAAAYLAR
jgi:hypothetical protein